MKKLLLLVVAAVLCFCAAAMAEDCTHPETAITYTELTTDLHEKKCGDCGQTWEEEHAFGAWQYSLDDVCAHECICGAYKWKSHTVYCDAKDYCLDCKSEGIEYPHIEHTCRDKEITKYDNEQHEYLCGELEYHTVNCDAPTVCTVCGADDLVYEAEDLDHAWSAYVDIDYDTHQATCGKCGYVTETWHNTEWQISQYGHANVCVGCGRKSEAGNHTAYCRGDLSCIDCGAENVVFEYVSHWAWCEENSKPIDNEHHRTYCGVLEKHEVSCKNPTTCVICGADDLVVPVDKLREHTAFGSPYVDLGSQHQIQCNKCGYASEPEKHTIICGVLVCWVCGHEATESELDHIEHSFGIETYAGTHHLSCSCGVEIEAPHEYNCDDFTSCIECGMGLVVPVEQVVVHHRAETYASIDAAQHKKTCSACGEEAVSDHEFGEDDICALCSYAKEPACLHPAESVEYVCLDDNQHQMTCSVCGLAVEAEHEFATCYTDNLHWWGCRYCGFYSEDEVMEMHVAGCWAPDVCLLCGAEGIIPYRLEHGDLDTESYTKWDNEYHYCPYCDLPEKHDVYCGNPNYCVICGADDLTGQPLHEPADAIYVDLGSQHQWTCICGETFVEEHANYCGETACYYCEHKFTEAELQNRKHAFYVEVDVYSHRLYCHCGYSIDSEPHTFYCDTLLCIECGVPRASDDTVGTILHREESYTSVSAEQHKKTCSGCTEEVLGDHEFDAEGICSLCGQVNAVSPARIPGDADDDGIVSILDALAVLQYDVGWGNVINNSNADVDGDGLVTILDALRILQRDVGWNVELL